MKLTVSSQIYQYRVSRLAHHQISHTLLSLQQINQLFPWAKYVSNAEWIAQLQWRKKTTEGISSFIWVTWPVLPFNSLLNAVHTDASFCCHRKLTQAFSTLLYQYLTLFTPCLHMCVCVFALHSIIWGIWVRERCRVDKHTPTCAFTHIPELVEKQYDCRLLKKLKICLILFDDIKTCSFKGRDKAWFDMSIVYWWNPTVHTIIFYNTHAVFRNILKKKNRLLLNSVQCQTMLTQLYFGALLDICSIFFIGRFSNIMLWDAKYVERQTHFLHSFTECVGEATSLHGISAQLPWQRSPTGLQGTQAYCLCFLYLDENMIYCRGY